MHLELGRTLKLLLMGQEVMETPLNDMQLNPPNLSIKTGSFERKLECLFMKMKYSVGI